MHWWSILISSAVAICLVGALIAYRMTGTLRVVALLICFAWIVQEVDARVYSNQLNTQFYLVCDAFICGYLVKGRQHWTDYVVVGIYASMAASYTLLTGAALWWFLYWGTLAQITLVMPWPVRKKQKGSARHGARKVIWS